MLAVPVAVDNVCFPIAIEVGQSYSSSMLEPVLHTFSQGNSKNVPMKYVFFFKSKIINYIRIIVKSLIMHKVINNSIIICRNTASNIYEYVMNMSHMLHPYWENP